MDPFLPHPLIFSSSSFSSSSNNNNIDPMFSGLSLQTLLSLNPSSLLPSSLSDHPPPPPPITPHSPQPPFNFFHHHHRLPQLLHSPKRHRFDPPPPPCRIGIPRMSSNLARQRRQKLSEKTRCLQKLMPWDNKMDQATLLEQAYKYVKFLQAQLTVLQSMPSSSSSSFVGVGVGVFGSDLERLNRNQVLQVLVNSPVAQTMLCSQGFCVFSMEQLFLLTNLSQMRFLFHQQIITDHHASLNNNNNNNTSSY